MSIIFSLLQLSKALWSSIRDNNFWELKHNFERDQQ
jgi:hypothetical protein